MVVAAGVRTSLVVLEQKMYVGPWQEYRALARARHAEALYATRGPETQVADELERLRRALELVSGELPADKAAKVREALAPVAEPGPPPLPGLSWNPRAAPRRPAPVARPVKPPQYVMTSLRLDDVRDAVDAASHYLRVAPVIVVLYASLRLSFSPYKCAEQRLLEERWREVLPPL